MQSFNEALGSVLMAAFTIFASMAAVAIKAWWANLLQQRIGSAAGRIAGEIVAAVKANPALEAATQTMVEEGGRILAQRVAQAVAGSGASPDTLRGMVAGEIGKLGMGISK